MPSSDTARCRWPSPPQEGSLDAFPGTHREEPVDQDLVEPDLSRRHCYRGGDPPALGRHPVRTSTRLRQGPIGGSAHSEPRAVVSRQLVERVQLPGDPQLDRDRERAEDQAEKGHDKGGGPGLGRPHERRQPA